MRDYLRVEDCNDIEARLAAEALSQCVCRKQTQSPKEHKLKAWSLLLENFHNISWENSHAIPIVAHENLASLKHFRLTVPPAAFGGNLPLIQTFPTNIKTRTIIASTLIAHAQPHFIRIGFRINGNTMPPTLDPTNVMPDANPLLTSNQCATTAKAVVVRAALLTPEKIPYTIMKCQYWVHCPMTARLMT